MMAQSPAGNRRSRPAAEHLALKYFRLGQELGRPNADRGPGFERLAAAHDLPATDNTWCKAIRLAARYRGKRQALEHLCRTRAGGGCIGWSHVIELMSVRDVRQRERLAAQVVRERLGAAALRQEIRHAVGRGSLRPDSGRKRREPRSLAEAIWRAQRDLDGLTFVIERLQTFDPALRRVTSPARRALGEIQALLTALGRRRDC